MSKTIMTHLIDLAKCQIVTYHQTRLYVQNDEEVISCFTLHFKFKKQKVICFFFMNVVLQNVFDSEPAQF